MNIYQKFINLAKQQGITDVEISFNKSSSLGISLYHSQIEEFNVNTDISTIIRGIYNNHFGTATCCTINKDNMSNLILDIINNAKIIEKEEEPEIFKGSKKYHKVSSYNKDYEKVSLEDKKELLFKLEDEIKKQSNLIKDVVDISFSESVSESRILNSHGLDLKQKSNYFTLVGGVVVKNDTDEQFNMAYVLDNDFNKIDIAKLAKKIVDGAVSKLDAKPCLSKKMKVVLDKDCVSTLVNVYISWANAESVQKHISLLEGKLNTKIASKKLTISDMPLKKTIYARWFDDEGVATYNKEIIKNGVLKTYLYCLETAKKDGVESTGNGSNLASKITAAPIFLYVKPGKKTLDELFKDADNGIYITDLQGTHAGINTTSGDFSLQAQGFLIENGKKGKPVSLITVSGNILEMFNNIIELGNDEETMFGISSPSILFKPLSISGE